MCPPGSFSKTEKSKECKKCPQNEYQDQEGKEKCKLCPINKFSRIGATNCKDIPKCTTNDYYLLPLAADTCKLTNGKYMRKQNVGIPKVPGKFQHDNIAVLIPMNIRNIHSKSKY